MASEEELKAEIERLRSENEKLKKPARGQMSLKARLSPDIRIDTLFVPFHWGGNGSANILTNTAVDPVARIPEFKVCAVRVEPDHQPYSEAETP